MKKRALSAREKVMIVILTVLLVGALYFLLFYQPLQNELLSLENQTNEVKTQIETAMVKVKQMDTMQAELDEIFANGNDVSEIAAYDNSQAVMNQLDGILASATEYDLSFADADIDEESGTVRRQVNMSFTCANYTAAKNIALALAENHWRCLVTSLSISSDVNDETGKNIMTTPVSVKATITFFESTKLAK